MSYNDYKRARDTAWRLLLDSGVDRLPVSINSICKMVGVKLHAYTKAQRLLRQSELDFAAQQTDGFCLHLIGEYHIFFDDTLPVSRQRFTIAHELGHITLGHIQEGERTIINREPSSLDAPEEIQANQFAARLLAPACVLHELRVFSPDRIAELCNISSAAAQIRAARMEVLEKRGKFYLSPLERAVREQFSDYIKAQGGPHPPIRRVRR